MSDHNDKLKNWKTKAHKTIITSSQWNEVNKVFDYSMHEHRSDIIEFLQSPIVLSDLRIDWKLVLGICCPLFKAGVKIWIRTELGPSSREAFLRFV